MKYFLLRDNLDIPDRWFLGPFHLPRPFSIWDFTKVGPILNDYSGLISDVRGKIVTDFTFADFAIPIITDRVAYYLPSAEIQLIKIKAGVFDNLSIMILLSADVTQSLGGVARLTGLCKVARWIYTRIIC